MAEKRMSIYGMIGILRAILVTNLAKYQYFSISTIELHILCYFKFNIMQMRILCPKKAQKYHFLNSRFFESVRYVLAYNHGYDKYFSIILF